MTELALIGGGLLAMGFVLWLALRQARDAGAADERAKGAIDGIKTAEKIAAAGADAPRDAGQLAERVRGGSWKL